MVIFINCVSGCLKGTEYIKNLQGVGGGCVVAPCFGGVAGGDVAPCGEDGLHACIEPCLDVAFGVAYIDAVFRLHLQGGAGVAHGQGAGFGFGAGVDADDDGGRDGEAEFGDKAVGEGLGFVGDDAPCDVLCGELGEQGVDFGEECGVAVEALFVFGEVVGAPLGKIGVFGRDACAQSDKGGCAVAGVGADLGLGFGGEPAFLQQAVEGVAEAGGGVGEGAV